MAALRAAGLLVYNEMYLAMLADACVKADNTEEALATLEDGLATVEETELRFYEAELHRRLGELVLLCGYDGRKAEQHYQRAIDVARRQNAKSWELRATMSLARLWQTEGKREAARNSLSEIYYWFTEGFDTPDLKDAKTLLEELA